MKEKVRSPVFMEETIKDILDSPDFKEFTHCETPKNISSNGFSSRRTTEMKIEIEEEEHIYETGDEWEAFISKQLTEDLTKGDPQFPDTDLDLSEWKEIKFSDENKVSFKVESYFADESS